jgi:hypothetical protein
MKTARIYQPSKTAMQSGRAKTAHWVLEFPRSAAMQPDALMGWNTMADTTQQLSLQFPSLEEAKAYAEAKHIAYHVIAPKQRAVPPKQYAGNFAYNKRRAFAENN